MMRRFWRSDMVPWVMLIALIGVWAALPCAYAQAPARSTGQETCPTGGHGIVLAPDLAFLLGVLTMVAGAALGYGIALQKLRAHCDDEAKHFTMEAIREAFMPREEVELLARSIVQEVLLKCRDG